MIDLQQPVKVTILDTLTKNTKIVKGVTIWSWTQGNWSCDCNRRPYFNLEEESDFCLGAKRFLVIEVDPMPESYTIDEFNLDYSKALIEENKQYYDTI